MKGRIGTKVLTTFAAVLLAFAVAPARAGGDGKAAFEQLKWLACGAVVTRWSSSLRVAASTASTASAKASALACEGLVEPLILRTYWSADAWVSSVVAGGSKLWRVLMFLHMRRS